MITWRAIVACCVAVLIGSLLAQTPPDEPRKSVHISGRLVFPDGSPVSFDVRLLRIDSDGPKDDVTAVAGPDGRFTFTATPGHRYKIALAAGGMKTPPKTVDITSSKDIDVGDMIFEYCAAGSRSIPKPPATSDLVGDLRPEQIVIEPQQAMNPYPAFVLLPTDFKPNNAPLFVAGNS